MLHYANCWNIISIPHLFFLHKIIPRTTSRMTTNSVDTTPAMVEVSEVSDIGVLARGLVDVVILEL